MSTFTVTRVNTLPDTGVKNDLHELISTATVTVNGLVNADIGAGAAIVDTKLATISTAGKVSGTSLAYLASIPSGAGVIPGVNTTAYYKARGYRDTTGHGIAHNTVTVVQFNGEAYDTAGEFDTSAYKYTATTSGYYLITGVLYYSAFASGYVARALINLDGVAQTTFDVHGASTDAMSVHFGDIMYVAASSYITISTYQNTGSEKVLSPGNTFVSIARIA